MHRPTVEAKLDDLLLARAENAFGHLANDFAIVGHASNMCISPVRDTVCRRRRPPACPLGAFLNRINRAEKLAPFFAVALQGTRPVIGRHAFEETTKDLLCAVGPRVRI